MDYPLGADLAVDETTFLRAKELEMSISSQTTGEQKAETGGRAGTSCTKEATQVNYGT